MQSLKILADITLPGMNGARTNDIIAIHKNILAIQRVFDEKIYKPGDICNTHVLVVTGVYNYVCVINIKLKQLAGYMAFINCQNKAYEAMCIFRSLCPGGENDTHEMETRFMETYHKVKHSQEALYKPVVFVRNNALQNAELVY